MLCPPNVPGITDVLDCAASRQAPLSLLCGFSGFTKRVRDPYARIPRFTSSLRGESMSHQSNVCVFFFLASDNKTVLSLFSNISYGARIIF